MTSFEPLGLSAINQTKKCSCDISGSGCEDQYLECSLPCPEGYPITQSNLFAVFGIPVVWVLVVTAVAGMSYALTQRIRCRSFFVGDRALSLHVLVLTLGCQALGTSSTVQNMQRSYSTAAVHGAIVPVGIGVGLILNGFFFAAPLSRMQLSTLPDLFARRYGIVAEILCSVLSVASTVLTISNNLASVAFLYGFLFSVRRQYTVILTAMLSASYVLAGGRQSVVCTDIIQGFVGWSGTLVGAAWTLFAFGIARDPIDHSAWQWRAFVDSDALAPRPNKVFSLWTTLLVQMSGTLMALDLQARTFSAASSRSAATGNLIAGVFSICIGLLWTLLGNVARRVYGPSSPHAEFRVDSCFIDAFDPSLFPPPSHARNKCAEWVPDPYASFKLIGTHMPELFGAWLFVTISLAAASTIDGALLSSSAVIAKNCVVTPGRAWNKTYWANDRVVLRLTRLITLSVTIVSSLLAMVIPEEQLLHASVLGLDIYLSACIAPLVAALYAPSTTPNGAILAMISGALIRIIFGSVLGGGPARHTPGLTWWGFGKGVNHVSSCEQPLEGTYYEAATLLAPAAAAIVLFGVSFAERTLKTDVLGSLFVRFRKPIDRDDCSWLAVTSADRRESSESHWRESDESPALEDAISKKGSEGCSVDDPSRRRTWHDGRTFLPSRAPASVSRRVSVPQISSHSAGVLEHRVCVFSLQSHTGKEVSHLRRRLSGQAERPPFEVPLRHLSRPIHDPLAASSALGRRTIAGIRHAVQTS